MPLYSLIYLFITFILLYIILYSFIFPFTCTSLYTFISPYIPLGSRICPLLHTFIFPFISLLFLYIPFFCCLNFTPKQVQISAPNKLDLPRSETIVLYIPLYTLMFPYMPPGAPLGLLGPFWGLLGHRGALLVPPGASWGSP